MTDQQDKTRLLRASDSEGMVAQSKRDAAGETVVQPRQSVAEETVLQSRRVAAGETVVQPRREVAGDLAGERAPDDATRPLSADIDGPALTIPEPRHGGDAGVEPADDRTLALPPVSPGADLAQTIAVPRHPVTTTETETSQTSSVSTFADLIHVTERVTPIHTGTVLRDRFVLVEEIGGGAMGLVFRARDLRKEEAGSRDPYVALKVLTPEYARDTRMMVALLEEAKKAQSLAHPNVITVYDADREGPVVFLTMELLQGETLKEVLARHRGGLPKDQAHDIIRGMSLGLAYAHRKGIVHSDFKPGNVFYTRAGETRVLDFGIARVLPRGSDEDAQPGAEQPVGGFTPTFASPQMLGGKDPEPNDDVFALGIVAYQLLTGVHPFGNRPADQAEAMGRTPERAKHFTRNEWRALSAALAFDPALRPQDASAFLKLFEGTSALRKWAIAAMVGFGITAGYLVYDGTQQVLETLPDVAFENLPVEQQASFNQLLGDGRLADQFNDYGSALDLYVRAYRIHPRNTEVVDAIDDLVDRISAQALASGSTRDRTSARENLRQVANVDEFLGSRPAITEALNALE